MNALTVLAALAAVAVTAEAKAAAIDEKHPITWYNCGGKLDGNYVHPYECTKFISCSGGIASERECAICHYDPVRCPEGQTVYDPSVDACLWADETTCSASPRPPTDEPSTTEDPITTDSPTSTTEDVELTTSAPGTACNDTCDLDGFCHDYKRCVNGHFVWQRCPGDLLFDKYDASGNPATHGGACSEYKDLSPRAKKEYDSDPDCLKCFFEEIKACSSTYLYQEDGGTVRNVQTLTCKGNLVFSKWYETCVKCGDYKDINGNAYACPNCP